MKRNHFTFSNIFLGTFDSESKNSVNSFKRGFVFYVFVLPLYFLHCYPPRLLSSFPLPSFHFDFYGCSCYTHSEGLSLAINFSETSFIHLMYRFDIFKYSKSRIILLRELNRFYDFCSFSIHDLCVFGKSCSISHDGLLSFDHFVI